MDSQSAFVNYGIEEFQDPQEPEELNTNTSTTHVSIGAGSGPVGSNDGSWEAVEVPDSPPTPLGDQANTADDLGHSNVSDRATGRTMGEPPPAAGYEPKYWNV